MALALIKRVGKTDVKVIINVMSIMKQKELGEINPSRESGKASLRKQLLLLPD